ncbi:MAG: guanylate kinase [Eubacterium sp.]|nr:guanylate kinase [Eubacterium sp.]
MGKIFYIMGKSAVGKDHIYSALRSDPEIPAEPLVLYTTRPMREGEENGREYFFTDEKHLEELRTKGRIIEERCYQTVYGPWYYFTADDGQIREDRDYLGIGTLESFVQLRRYFGKERVLPIYIEVDDGLRLERALKRERKQPEPKYEEMCRRFLADAADFSEEKIREASIERRFRNDGEIGDCVLEAKRFILGE